MQQHATLAWVAPSPNANCKNGGGPGQRQSNEDAGTNNWGTPGPSQTSSRTWSGRPSSTSERGCGARKRHRLLDRDGLVPLRATLPPEPRLVDQTRHHFQVGGVPRHAARSSCTLTLIFGSSSTNVVYNHVLNDLPSCVAEVAPAYCSIHFPTMRRQGSITSEHDTTTRGRVFGRARILCFSEASLPDGIRVCSRCTRARGTTRYFFTTRTVAIRRCRFVRASAPPSAHSPVRPVTTWPLSTQVGGVQGLRL